MLKQPKAKGSSTSKQKDQKTVKLSSDQSDQASISKQPTNQKPKPTMDDVLGFIKLLNPKAHAQVSRDVASGKLKSNFIAYFHSFDKLYIFLHLLFKPDNMMRFQLRRDIFYNYYFNYINQRWVDFKIELHSTSFYSMDYPFQFDDINDNILYSQFRHPPLYIYHPELIHKHSQFAITLNKLATLDIHYHNYWIRGKNLNDWILDNGIDTKYMYIHPDNDKPYVKSDSKYTYFDLICHV